jgi:hypothetical protein
MARKGLYFYGVFAYTGFTALIRQNGAARALARNFYWAWGLSALRCRKAGNNGNR